MRGEKHKPSLSLVLPMGSPPRARGKGPPSLCNSYRFGITPACAGKSPLLYVPFARVKDHPRVRGEKISQALKKLRREGSPPRARGKACLRREVAPMRGITPACAGKSCRGDRADHNVGDHPRVRGEKSEDIDMTQYEEGSPPRARGKGKRRTIRAAR